MVDEVKTVEVTKADTKKKAADVKSILKIANRLLGRNVDGVRQINAFSLNDMRGFGVQIAELAGSDERLVMFGEVMQKALGVADVVGAATQIVQAYEEKPNA